MTSHSRNKQLQYTHCSILQIYTFSKQTIAIHSLFNIANIHILETNNCNTLIVQYCKYKDNQTIKFGQLIEKNMRNIYDMKNNLKNHTQNVVEKVFPDLILKYQN